jgi:hypothetical protein
MTAPGSVTLAQIRTRAQQESDMENSTFVSTSEWNSYINASYKELYDLLVGAYGNDYYVAAPSTFVTDGTSQFYTLPTDFYKLLGVDVAMSNTPDSYVTLKPFQFSERNRYSVPNFQSFYGVTNLRYRLKGSELWLTPIASAGQTIQVWYVPEPTSLALDADTLDGISGWEEYVVIDAAIKAMAKEESDVAVLGARKQAMLERITIMAESRDAGSPAVVSDVQGASYGWPYDDGAGGY